MNGSEIALRPPEPSDAEALFEMVDESVASTYPVQSWCPGYAIEDARGWIEHGQITREKGSEYHFVVYYADSKRLIGTTSIIRVDQANQLAQTGYFIREGERSKGFVGVACLLTVQYAFQELKLHRLELLIAIHNPSSVRVAEKVGAVREGVLKERLKWSDTIFHDAYLYALINQDGKASSMAIAQYVISANPE